MLPPDEYLIKHIMKKIGWEMLSTPQPTTLPHTSSKFMFYLRFIGKISYHPDESFQGEAWIPSYLIEVLTNTQVLHHVVLQYGENQEELIQLIGTDVMKVLK